MTQLGQAQVGLLRSTPKLTRINGDDNLKVIWRNMGNNHAYPFVWASEATHSGTSTLLVASGTKFHGFDLYTYANITATPLASPGSYFWIHKNPSNGNIYIRSSGSMSNVPFDVKFMLGVDPDITGITCGTWSADNIKADLP